MESSERVDREWPRHWLAGKAKPRRKQPHEPYRFGIIPIFHELPVSRLSFAHETNHKRPGVNAVKMCFFTNPEKIVPTDFGGGQSAKGDTIFLAIANEAVLLAPALRSDPGTRHEAKYPSQLRDVDDQLCMWLGRRHSIHARQFHHRRLLGLPSVLHG
jgi:hypothetical protein